MILKSITLQNIRSYISQRIDFPEGSVMLSGDIGSGKSTILLAIEFALFGIMKGDVSGESLLRNGKKEGSVELCLEINGKDIIINRVLKRSSQGVKQDSGFIVMNSTKKQCTSTELKAAILDLLGYPKDLLTKSKGLIYRYTVYTPQEDMKKILFEDEEARLNTLRRVFDVDKYRRIRENSKVYTYGIKGRIKEIEGFISDLEEKRKKHIEMIKEISDAESKITGILPKAKLSKELADRCRKEAAECEKEIESLSKMRNELAVSDSELRSRVMQSQRNRADIERISKGIEALEKEVKEIKEPAASLKSMIKEKDDSLRFMEDTRLNILRKIAEMSSKKEACNDTKQKVAKIDSCPLCLQDVSHEHKKSITQRENAEIARLDEEIKVYSSQEKDAEKKIKEIRAEIELLRKKEIEAEAARIKMRELKEKRESAERLGKEQEDIKKSIGLINQKKIKLSEGISHLKDSEDRHKKARQSLDEAQQKLHKVEIELNTVETEKRTKLSAAKSLNDEIAKKEASKSSLKQSKDLVHWIETDFVSLMALMEKQVMAKVYHSFNELFQNWFSSLMEDEAITSRLDDSFTPLVQQNGYDTNISFLSGGEKTSCALAYRLSLNKVINDFISNVQTKDIIILDEPTDGFSTEQLDRVREVIDQLNMRQILIVSHEQKVEGFVDSVIRIKKEDHISSVA